MKLSHDMKILIIDLETYGFDFSADKGFVLCGSYKWYGEAKVHTVTHTDMTKFRANPEDDKAICKELLQVIEQADMLVGWNSKSFDMRFLQTRLLKHRLGYLPPIPHVDLLLTSRNNTKMRRSLDNTQKFFGFGHEKTPLDINVWMKAGAGKADALRDVVKHCEADVRVTEEAYELFAPLARTHPNVMFHSGDRSGCPTCGVDKLQQRGKAYALRYYRLRFHCQNCGRWATSGPIKYPK